MLKAAKEGKVHTTWTETNAAYEDVRNFSAQSHVSWLVPNTLSIYIYFFLEN
jgi:maltooligosyltrehalose synthase